MTYTRLCELLTKLASRAVKNSCLVALAMVATFTSVAIQPVQAQSADTWKSIAIIGGSTAAGAYVGQKIAGPTGALVGAELGTSAGYAIDQYRRRNEYYNQYGYGDGGYYTNSSGYSGNGAYYGDSGYYSDAYDGSAYQSGYLTSNRNRCSRPDSNTRSRY